MRPNIAQQVGKWLTVGMLVLGLSMVCQAEQPTQQKLSLKQAIKIALANNLSRRLAQDDVKIARDKIAQSISAYGPTLTVDGGYKHYNEIPSTLQLQKGLIQLTNAINNSNMATPDDGLNYYGYQVQLTQLLYTGRKLTATKDQAKANEKNAQANLIATDRDLVLAVKKAYYTVSLCQQMVNTMDEAVAGMEKHLVEANAYFKSNLVPKLDVLRAEEKLADLKQKQLLAQNNLILANSSLRYVLGVDTSNDYICENTTEYQQFPKGLFACQKEALEQRPEITASDAKIEMARQSVLIAKSGNKPSVAFVASHSKYEPNDDAPSTTVGVVATMKLFDSGMVTHQVTEANDTLKQAETAKELVQRGIKLEVEQAYHNVAAALKTIEVARKSQATAEEALRVAETRYKVGLSTSLERLDAEVGLTQARTNYNQALSMYQIALAELDKAMGKNESIDQKE